MEEEIWKDVKGYEGLYQVSNLGRVCSLERQTYDTVRKYIRKVRKRILKQALPKLGYYSVQLTKNGKQKSFRVHVLVAAAFLPNPNNFPVINHKNAIKTDNRVENLEWCTYQHNSKEAVRLRLNRYK